MHYNVNRGLEVMVKTGVTHDHAEDAAERLLKNWTDSLGVEQNAERSPDISFDGRTVNAFINTYVGFEFEDVFRTICFNLDKLVSRPATEVLTTEDGNGLGPSARAIAYGRGAKRNP